MLVKNLKCDNQKYLHYVPLKVHSGGISVFLFYKSCIFQWNADATHLKWNGF